METLVCPEILTRADFALLANARGLMAAVEVGTDRGWWARRFLERWHGHTLYCVDPYGAYPGMPGDRSADFLMAVATLSPFVPRVRLLRLTSLDAAACYPHGLPDPIDFVYVDADHRFEAVSEDLEAWWRRLTPRGVLAGHDYDADHPGVMDAVVAFAERHQRRLFLTRECDVPPSWYLYRNEPEALIPISARDDGR